MCLAVYDPGYQLEQEQKQQLTQAVVGRAVSQCLDTVAAAACAHGSNCAYGNLQATDVVTQE